MALSVRSACIIGVGGLGCPAASALAKAGVSSLTLVDPDRVELSNLHRQLLHTEADLGVPKVQSAKAKLLARHPALEVRTIEDRCTPHNAEPLFQAHDVVIDATDGADTKFMLSDMGVKTGTTLIYAGALKWEGVVMRIERGGACLRCLFEAPPAEALTCAQAGIVGSVVALVGTLQAIEALRAPLPTGALTSLLTIDGRSLSIRRVRVPRRPECPACGDALRRGA